jgi:tRNA pseudouridine38-40 synthase
MRTLKLTVAYDGTNYVGWQRQANGTSVQQLLEEAIAPLVGEADRTPTIAGASRTDAGVHALGQVASATIDLALETRSLHRALNVRLPPDIRVLAVEEAVPGFHARFRSRSKAYRYRMATTRVLSPFDRWFVWHAPEPRDPEAMQRAARALVGCHDFASFQARGSTTVDTVRTLERVEVTSRPGEITVDVVGNGFLRHMVRAIVGTLAEVGTGLRTVESMPDILGARDRAAAGVTAPAAGLTLVDVHYD